MSDQKSFTVFLIRPAKIKRLNDIRQSAKSLSRLIYCTLRHFNKFFEDFRFVLSEVGEYFAV